MHATRLDRTSPRLRHPASDTPTRCSPSCSAPRPAGADRCGVAAAERAAERLAHGFGTMVVVVARRARGRAASAAPRSRTTAAGARPATPAIRRCGRASTRLPAHSTGRPLMSSATEASASSSGTSASAMRTMPRAVAERAVERLPQRDADVLDRVVLVDVQVAARRDVQVEQPVLADLLDEVVEHPDARLRRGPGRCRRGRASLRRASPSSARTTVAVRVPGRVRQMRWSDPEIG